MAKSFTNESQQVVLSLCLFSLPALVYAGGVVVPVLKRPHWLLPAFVILAPLMYWWFTRTEDHAPRTGNAHESGEYSPTERQPEPSTAKIELVAANYEQLSDQAKYRDKLLINANYFSLAIIAVLVNVFLSTGPEVRPLIAMIGSVTAYAFWLATESYKGSRDAIIDRLGDIEGKQYPELNVVSAYDSRNRTRVGKRSLSSYLMGIQIVATTLWGGIYFSYILYLSFNLGP